MCLVFFVFRLWLLWCLCLVRLCPRLCCVVGVCLVLVAVVVGAGLFSRCRSCFVLGRVRCSAVFGLSFACVPRGGSVPLCFGVFGPLVVGGGLLPRLCGRCRWLRLVFLCSGCVGWLLGLAGLSFRGRLWRRVFRCLPAVFVVLRLFGVFRGGPCRCRCCVVLAVEAALLLPPLRRGLFFCA